MSKKILAMLMAVAMAFSLLPVTAFAEGENAPVAPTTIYVSTTGTEGADGTESNPFQTIQDAVSYIEEEQQKSESTDATWIISVAEGTYSRFLVPHGVKNITIQGSGDKTVINTLDGSSLSVDESSVHDSDGQGIIVWGANITLKNLNIISGTNKKDMWYASAVGTQDGMWGSAQEASTPVILDNCTFLGKGVGYAFMPQREAFTVQNCRFENYEQAIYFACDNYSANDCKIIGNTIKDCIYAIHGYYGASEATKVMELANNTVIGTANRFSVIAVLDQNNTGAVKLNIHDNQFSYAIVGGINQRTTGHDAATSRMSDVMDKNNMKDHSFVVDAYWYSATDYGTMFYAPKQSGKIATWYADPTTEAGNDIGEAIKNALTEYGTAGQIIEINAPAQEIFTLAKNAIVIEDYVDAGDLKITKTVSNNEADNTEFSFTVNLTRPTTEANDTNEKPLNGYYDVVMDDGTTQTEKLENGELTVTMKSGQSVTIKDLLPGTKFTVTERKNAWYTSTETGATGTIVAKETQTAAFDNVYSPKWTISKSKTATNLDSNYESKVTLSIPSAETTASADIVIVMDVSSSMYPTDITEAKSAASQLCDRLNEKKNAKIKVGIVTFDQEAHELTNGLVSVEEAKEKVESITRSSDTNMMAGLIAGKKMLDEGTSSDKYMVIMSDGIPTYWVENGATISKKVEHYANNQLTKTEPAGTEPEGSWEWSNADKIVPMETLMSRTDWDSDSNIWKQDSNTGESLNPEYKYTNIQKAAYKTARYLEDEIIGKYKVKMVAYGTDKHKTSIVYKYGENFCDWIGQQGGVSYYKVPKVSYGGEAGDLKDVFDSISDEIIYLVDNGSYVTDYMGYVEGDYNFDFINDVSKLSITVGTEENQETLKAEKIAENHYGFGRIEKEKEPEAAQEMTTSEISYRYELEYVPGKKKGDEHFTWQINVPVSNFAPVALTYSVKLVNPKSASGTYGQYDEDGSKNYSGLYTNNSATLYPMDSKGQSGVPENFLKPTVSYTVSGGNSGGNNGGNSKPSLNTKDHYGYIIGYPVDYYTGQPTTDQTKKPVRPEGKITRAEVATIYFRMLTDESRTKFWSQNSGYSDVKTGDWFNNAVSTLSNAGIIAGYEDGSFRPNGYITRAEFATIAARFFDVTYNGKDLFPDISGHWAKDYINQAANKGFVNGYEDGTFKPDRNITRAEAVTLVNRTLDRHPDKSHFTKDMLVWPDNMDQTKWYYADMQEATNSHTYQMKENSDKTKYENWTKTLPIRNWEALEKAWSNANSSQGNGNVV